MPLHWLCNVAQPQKGNIILYIQENFLGPNIHIVQTLTHNGMVTSTSSGLENPASSNTLSPVCYFGRQVDFYMQCLLEVPGDPVISYLKLSPTSVFPLMFTDAIKTMWMISSGMWRLSHKWDQTQRSGVRLDMSYLFTSHKPYAKIKAPNFSTLYLPIFNPLIFNPLLGKW